MKSRVRESRTHGSVRGWHREMPVYSTEQGSDKTLFYVVLGVLVDLSVFKGSKPDSFAIMP